MRKILLVAAVLTLTIACKKEKIGDNKVSDPPAPQDEEEVITTFKIQLKDSSAVDAQSYFFKDPDGPGGQNAFYGPEAANQADSVIMLKKNKTYFAEITLLNESVNPAVNISNEVQAEGNAHMIFFNQNTGQVLSVPRTIKPFSSNFFIVYDDLDGGDLKLPIGLKTKWRTGTDAVSGLLDIVLKHQPGNKDGSFGPGETDISVRFRVKIE